MIHYAPFHDTLYYWDWSRHLGWSYYDGPPMIAYLIYGFTSLFGNSSFSLNLMGLISNLIITFFIYRLAKILFSKNTAILSALLWLLSSSTFIQYNLKVEYDTPVTLFWIITLYFFALAHFSKKNSYFYLAGISAGLMMLSKYTGILLFLAIFMIMITSKNYRYLFKNKHIYFACALSIIVFSPVIIWNVEHHFASFVFQLGHGFKHSLQFMHIFNYLLLTLTMYHLIFIFFIAFIFLYRKIIFHDSRLELVLYPALVTFLFFLFVSPYSFKNNWNNTFYITAVILVACFFMRNPFWKKMIAVIFTVNLAIIATICLVVFNKGELFNHHIYNGGYQNKSAILAIDKYYQQNDKVFTYHYTLAAELAFYLPHHPYIYSFSSGAHQYYYWSKKLMKTIKEKKITKILYITKNDIIDDETKSLFPTCHKLNDFNKKNPYALDVYQCYS